MIRGIGYEPPQLLSREVLASSEDAESFGWQLAARAWQRGFPAAARLGFVADGAHANWTIQEKHFSRAIPILDLMHALGYAYSAAECVCDQPARRRWAGWIWQGEIDRVISELLDHQGRLGEPPAEASSAFVIVFGQRGASPLQVCTLRPVTESNCVSVRKGGEQLEVNEQSVG